MGEEVICLCAFTFDINVVKSSWNGYCNSFCNPHVKNRLTCRTAVVLKLCNEFPYTATAKSLPCSCVSADTHVCTAAPMLSSAKTCMDSSLLLR